MSEELIAAPLESIENRGAAGLWVKVAGKEYRSLDYVEPFVTRRRIGDLVDISFSQDKEGFLVLTKIAPHKGGGGGQNPKNGKSTSPQKPAKEISSILRKISHPYLMTIKEGEEKLVLYCLSNEMRDRIETDPALKIPQRIKISIDPYSFVLGYELGEPISEEGLAPIAAPMKTAGEIKQEKEKEKAKQATISEPPKKEEPPKEESLKEEAKEEQPPKADDNSASPHPSEELLPLSGRYILRLGGTCSLDGYENLKLEIEGDVDPKNIAEREALIRYWDDTLGLFGRNSPVTKDKIDSFRRRVILGALS